MAININQRFSIGTLLVVSLLNVGIVLGMLLSLIQPDLSMRLMVLVAIELVLVVLAYSYGARRVADISHT